MVRFRELLIYECFFTIAHTTVKAKRVARYRFTLFEGHAGTVVNARVTDMARGSGTCSGLVQEALLKRRQRRHLPHHPSIGR